LLHADTAQSSEALLIAEPEGGAASPNASFELIGKGEELYQTRCGACHSLDQNRIGPMHRGVFGRKAGSVDGYSYSPALRDLDIIWDRETLDAWLENPMAFAPGAAMGFRLPDAEERRAIIAYLESLSETPAASEPD